MNKADIQKAGACILMGMALLVGCQQEGPAERAGKALDQSAEDANEFMIEQREQAEDYMDDTSERLDSDDPWQPQE